MTTRNLLVLWCYDGSTHGSHTFETTSDAQGDDLIALAYDLIGTKLDQDFDCPDAFSVDHVVELPEGFERFTVTHRQL